MAQNVMYPGMPLMMQKSGMSSGYLIVVGIGILAIIYLLFKDKIDPILFGTTPSSDSPVTPPTSGQLGLPTPTPPPPPNPPTPPLKPGYSYKGCYADDGSRKLPQFLGNLSIEDCAAQTKAKGFKAFGIQYSAESGLLGVGGECRTGNDSGYSALGPANNCALSGGRYFGDWWSNAVYEWDRL